MRRARLGVFAISFVVLTILLWSTIIQHPLQLDTPTDQQSAPASARSDAEQNRYYGFQRRAENDFTAEELEQARKIAENWLEIIKTNGTLFLNENSRQ